MAAGGAHIRTDAGFCASSQALILTLRVLIIIDLIVMGFLPIFSTFDGTIVSLSIPEGAQQQLHLVLANTVFKI